MKRITIDMDDTIVDTLSVLLKSYNSEFGETLSPADFAGQEITEALRPDRHSRIDAYLLSDGFFRDLPVMPDSQDVIEQLSEQYEVFIATAAMEFPSSFTQKFEWLNEHFPFIPASRIVFCGDKSIIHADYLIDDRPRHFEHFVGEGIVFTAPHNLHETRYRRADSWLDVAAMLL